MERTELVRVLRDRGAERAARLGICLTCRDADARHGDLIGRRDDVAEWGEHHRSRGPRVAERAAVQQAAQDRDHVRGLHGGDTGELPGLAAGCVDEVGLIGDTAFDHGRTSRRLADRHCALRHGHAGVERFERGARQLLVVAQIEELRGRELVSEGHGGRVVPVDGRGGDREQCITLGRGGTELGDPEAERDDLLIDVEARRRVAERDAGRGRRAEGDEPVLVRGQRRAVTARIAEGRAQGGADIDRLERGLGRRIAECLREGL